MDDDEPWWIGPAGGQIKSSNVDWTCLAQNNILSPFHLDVPSVVGSSSWEPLTSGQTGGMLVSVATGVRGNDGLGVGPRLGDCYLLSLD